MFDKFKKKENNKTDLYSLLPKEKYYATSILDDENILVAKYNNGIYSITHYSLIDNTLKVVAKWNQYNLRCFRNTIFNYVLNNEYIFIPSIKDYSFSYQSIYNYKTHKFIIKNNVFDSISVFPYKEHSTKTFLLGEINITNECPYIEYTDSLSNKTEIYYSNLLGVGHLPHQTTKAGTDEHDKLIKEKGDYFVGKWKEKNPDLLKYKK